MLSTSPCPQLQVRRANALVRPPSAGEDHRLARRSSGGPNHEGKHAFVVYVTTTAVEHEAHRRAAFMPPPRYVQRQAGVCSPFHAFCVHARLAVRVNGTFWQQVVFVGMPTYAVLRCAARRGPWQGGGGGGSCDTVHFIYMRFAFVRSVLFFWPHGVLCTCIPSTQSRNDRPAAAE